MIPVNFDYEAPTNLQEALDLLSDPEAKPLAGGMSLIPMMKLRLAAPSKLVDLQHIADLNQLRQDNNVIRIGAMTTHYAIESSLLLHEKCPLLPQTATAIGDIQVRNVGTIGGSVAHADPAADYPAALLALDAQIQVISKAGERTIPVAEFFQDTFITALEPGELVKEIIVPVETADTRTCYLKWKHPASGFAVAGVAVRLTRTNGKIDRVAIGVTGIAPRPFRASNVEERLLGTQGSEEDIRKAVEALADGLELNSDLYASADYRRHLARVLAARALRRCLQTS